MSMGIKGVSQVGTGTQYEASAVNQVKTSFQRKRRTILQILEVSMAIMILLLPTTLMIRRRL